MPTQKEINKLLEKVALLQQENDKLKEEQLEFFEAVAEQIEEIEKTNSFWKYFKYIQLVIQMVATIKEFADKKKK